MEVVPQSDVEAVANGIEQSRHRLFRQIVVILSRAIAEGRNVNGDLPLATTSLRNTIGRLLGEIRFEYLAFDAIAAQLHRLVAAEVVHEPLPQVGVKLDIYADLAHGINVLMPWFTYTKLRKISELCGIKRPWRCRYSATSQGTKPKATRENYFSRKIFLQMWCGIFRQKRSHHIRQCNCLYNNKIYILSKNSIYSIGGYFCL